MEYDTIPAIITKDEFDKATEIIKNNSSKRRIAPTHLLRGNIVKCGCCSYALSYNKLSDPIFRCYHTAADSIAKCHKLKVNVSMLDKIVLTEYVKKQKLY